MSEPPPLPPEPGSQPGNPFAPGYKSANQGDGYGGPSQDSKNLAMLAHLLGLIGFLGPLLIWLLKKDDDPFIDEQGKEALNFQLTMLIGSLICAVTIVGFFLLPVLMVIDIVFCITAGLKAKDGIHYQYPFCLRLIS